MLVYIVLFSFFDSFMNFLNNHSHLYFDNLPITSFITFFHVFAKDIDKGPSKVTLFASYNTINFPKDKCPAKEAAS